MSDMQLRTLSEVVAYIRKCCANETLSLATIQTAELEMLCDAAVGWLPIRTAPKDGSEIIVGTAGSGDVEFCRWFPDDGVWLDRGCDDFEPATHWMPRPIPPHTDS